MSAHQRPITSNDLRKKRSRLTDWDLVGSRNRANLTVNPRWNADSGAVFPIIKSADCKVPVLVIVIVIAVAVVATSSSKLPVLFILLRMVLSPAHGTSFSSIYTSRMQEKLAPTQDRIFIGIEYYVADTITLLLFVSSRFVAAIAKNPGAGIERVIDLSLFCFLEVY